MLASVEDVRAGRLPDDEEHDDLCAALSRSIETDPDEAVAILEELLPHWSTTGRRQEGREWCRRVIAATSDPVKRVQVGLYEGQLARDQGDPAAVGILEAHIAEARELHDAATVALGLTILAPTAFQTGRIAEAKQMASEALTLLRRAGHPRRVVEALNVLGNVATVEGDASAAYAYYEDALAVSREAGLDEIVSRLLLNLGSLSVGRSNFVRAREYYKEAQALALEFGDTAVGSAALTNLGVITKAEGDNDRARAILDEALALKRSMGDARGTAIVLQGLADLDRSEGRHVSSRSLVRQSLEMCRDLDFSLGMISGLETFAASLADAGASEAGLRLAAAAHAARAATGQRRSAEDTTEFDRLVMTLRAGIGEHDAQACWDQGTVLTLADATSYVLAMPLVDG